MTSINITEVKHVAKFVKRMLIQNFLSLPVNMKKNNSFGIINVG